MSFVLIIDEKGGFGDALGKALSEDGWEYKAILTSNYPNLGRLMNDFSDPPPTVVVIHVGILARAEVYVFCEMIRQRWPKTKIVLESSVENGLNYDLLVSEGKTRPEHVKNVVS